MKTALALVALFAATTYADSFVPEESDYSPEESTPAPGKPSTCTCDEYRNGATAGDADLCMGPSESWGTPCYPKPSAGCNSDWTECGEDVEVTPQPDPSTCACDEYRNGATAGDADLCMGPSESWGTPCYPKPSAGCNSDWTECDTKTTPAPATPVPATPVPATPVPATPVPETPVPATPVPATPATPVPATPVPSATTPEPTLPPAEVDVTPVQITFTFGFAAEGVTAADIAKDAKAINAALTKIIGEDASSVRVIKICVGTDCVEISTEDLAARLAQLLQNDPNRAITVVTVVIPQGAAASLSASALADKVVDAVKKDISSGNSELKAATPSSGALDNLKADDVAGVGVLAPNTPAPTATATATVAESLAVAANDDDLSGKAIAAIVVGSLALVVLIGAAAMALGSKKDKPVEAGNEPTIEEA